MSVRHHPIRVVLAEDHDTVRQGLKLLIEQQEDMTIVGEAGDGRSAVDCITNLKPAVAVLDVAMPEMNGLAAARAIRQLSPETAVVALTRYDDSAYVRELLAAGACGYVLKQSRSETLLSAIRAAASGKRFIDSALADPDSQTPGPRRRGRGTAPPISEREQQVLRMMARGHSNKEIATALGISVKTIEVHKANAMRKLNLMGRVDVIRFAMLQGWLQEP